MEKIYPEFTESKKPSQEANKRIRKTPKVGDYFRIIHENWRTYEVRVNSVNAEKQLCVVYICGLCKECIAHFKELLQSHGYSARVEQWTEYRKATLSVTKVFDCSACAVGNTLRVKCEDGLNYEAQVKQIIKEKYLYLIWINCFDAIKVVTFDMLMPCHEVEQVYE
ncbi:uncharacterized protein LOC119669540 [Teleopsis dalmanni]|uniref:uncharacterized protein LOC119669540 n=1 Tax=Teleopsis dalmanni TaxID=139649 RepID=UPI0018CDB5C0|nr:uncharacterized protein LOC119669540 [Teleopsis dalmanni]